MVKLLMIVKLTVKTMYESHIRAHPIQNQNNFYQLMQMNPQPLQQQQQQQQYIQSIQNENMMLRQQINRLNTVAKTLDDKYQKSLKEMSSIIQANQNLKKELDNIKIGIKDQIEGAVRDMRAGYEKKIEQMVIQKNDVYVSNQSLLREKEQLQRDYSAIERTLWETQSLKTQITNLKKQNEKLLLQTHPLTQNQDNPEQKAVEQKLTQKIDELNSKIIQLNVQTTQSRKYAQTLQQQKLALAKQNDILSKKVNQLNASLENAQAKDDKQANLEAENKVIQAKKYQMQSMELRKQNAQLTNQIQKLRLQKLEITSENNKNEAELHLLTTLKSLHSQLEPMRYEIEELKRDKYYDRENSNKEKAELQMKLLSHEHQLQTQKQYVKDLESRNKDLAQQIRQKQWQKTRYQQLQQQKRILEGRVIVYEAMQMVSRNRDKPHHVERLQQFQRRIQLLLQEENLEYLVNNANVHQLIAMKAYIIQLDNKLQVILEQNQHINRKYAQYKQKYQILVSENKQIINKHYSTVNAYKGKIAGYEKLVIKLTDQLQRYIKETQGPSGIESHYKSVITLYESKIMSIHNEVNARKQENRDLVKKFENLEMEHKGKLALIKELETELSNTKAQVKQMGNKMATRDLDQQQPKGSFGNVAEDHYRSIIAQKTKQILDLEENLSKLKFKIDKMEFEHDRELQSYKHKINRLEIEIEHLRLEQESANKQISTAKHSEEFGQLVYKLSNLEKNIADMSKSQANLQKPRESNVNIDLERQVSSLKHENELLLIQLQKLRVELNRKITQQNNQLIIKQVTNDDQPNKFRDQANRHILQLQNRINELEAELKIKIKESEIKSREIQRGNAGKNQITIQPGSSNVNAGLEEENAHLRSELERIRTSYNSMTLESQGLMVKIRETQAYISTLRDQFNRVCAKMNQYQRQLNYKEQKIREWELKYKNLQHQLEGEVGRAKSNAGALNDREIQQQLRKIKESQLEIERAFREIDSKVRDLERRQIQANRRESEIDMKNKDLKDRMRKLEERERIVNDEENRLIRWSQELDQRERRLHQAEITKPIPTPSPSINKQTDSSYRDQYQDLERRFKRLEIQLKQKIQIIGIKDQKMDKLIKERAQLARALQQARGHLDQKSRSSDTNQRQISSLRQQITRLQGQLQKLWKEYDILKQQLRTKEREVSDGGLEKEEIKTKLEIEIRQLNYRIKELESSRTSTSPSQPPKNLPNFNQIQKQFEDRLRQIEQRHKLKIRELYRQNEQSSRQFQQTITELTLQLSRYKMQSPAQNKSEIETHTQAIHSLESHIKTLEDEVHRKQGIINQLEEDLKYYKNVLAQREEELQKLYESTFVPSNSSHTEGDNFNLERMRLQNEIISLQMELKNKNTENANHDDCIRKQHVLRMQIQRLNGILQSKISEHEHTNIHPSSDPTEKPVTPHSQYLDNSYLNQLEQTNRNLEADLNELKARLISNFDTNRSIDEYLAILVITFAEVDALRQRIYELEQNFKQEHERELSVIKQIDEIKDKNIDIEKILAILKELQIAHRAFHEQQQRSKSTFIKRINTEVIVMPGSQALSINDQINRKGSITQQSQFSSSRQQIGSFELRPLTNTYNYGERSIKNSLMEDSLNKGSQYQFNFSSLPASGHSNLTNTITNTNTNTNININRGFATDSSQSGTNTQMGAPGFGFNLQQVQFNSSTSGIGGSLAGGYQGPALTKIDYGSGNNFMGGNVQFGSSLTTGNYSTSIGMPMSIQPRAPMFSTSSQPPSRGMSPIANRHVQGSPIKGQQFSPGKRLQITQPYQFYQYSQGSQSSLRFPSETMIPQPPQPLPFRPSQTNVSPYIMSNNQLYR